AISTPPGRGGIGIVRLSGPQAVSIATPLLRLRHLLVPAQTHFAAVLDPATGQRLDEAVVTWFAAPSSYTTEDVVEIAAHGAPVVLDFLVRACVAGGARLARPGEFTERAFLSGRLDLTQAEAVRDLIDAQTLYQAKIASEQLDGALSRRIRPIKQKLVELIAELEAGIDFAEDDVAVMSNADALLRIAAVAAPLREMAAGFAYGRIVRDGFSLAIVGRPNTGKSSLFNRLVQRERAIVTATPGTTRDLVTERISLGGIPVDLMDTAGLREAMDEAESIGVGKTREALADADLVLLVLDATAPQLHAEEQRLLVQLAGRRALVARNKMDLLPNGQMEDAAQAGEICLPVVPTSAVTGDGIAVLREQVLSLVRGDGMETESGLVTNLRQQQAVTAALEALAAATNAVETQVPHEMLLLDLYNALRALDALTGETTSDEILGLIFSTFCIGK
ncbi:MAG: tRNA uridine-5-carboxymethylaminomethyl(34) synthesis GTPase MnmE, partial [Acidobacteriaceae bacterium]